MWSRYEPLKPEKMYYVNASTPKMAMLIVNRKARVRTKFIYSMCVLKRNTADEDFDF